MSRDLNNIAGDKHFLWCSGSHFLIIVGMGRFNLNVPSFEVSCRLSSGTGSEPKLRTHRKNNAPLVWCYSNTFTLSLFLANYLLKLDYHSLSPVTLAEILEGVLTIEGPLSS